MNRREGNGDNTMNHFEQRFQELLAQLLDGELTEGEAGELAHLCQSNPRRADDLRGELELAEMIRLVATGDSLDPFAVRIAARFEPAPEADFGDLLRGALDESLDERAMEDLVRHCWRDESAARSVRRALMQDDLMCQLLSPGRDGEAFIESLATRMWAQQEEDHFVEEVADRIVKMRPDLPPAPRAAVRISRRRESTSSFAYLGGWAAAAAAVVGLIAAILFQPGQSGPMTSVAEMTRSAGEVRWSTGSGPLETQYFVPGRYSLESGVVTVAFASGAEMTIEGPADFEVWDERQAFVHTGVAVLAKNAAIDTFRLRTPALDLGDSGEMIGLIADGSSTTEAVVFNGDAKVCLSEQGQCRSLFPLEPVRADLDREKLFDVPYNPEVFARAWEVNAGVERNSGPVRLAMPGQHPGEGGGRAGEVEIFVEKSRFIADHEIEVDTLEPGQFASMAADGGRKLTSDGRELRSYLLQLNPGEMSDDGEALEASVTFDREIVGVIFTQDRLDDSDSMVGAGTLSAAQNRGLDASSDGLADAGDRILLSDDRRTVNLSLRGGSADRLDHVRVLVALN